MIPASLSDGFFTGEITVNKGGTTTKEEGENFLLGEKWSIIVLIYFHKRRLSSGIRRK
jgi:hypothetical protein